MPHRILDYVTSSHLRSEVGWGLIDNHTLDSALDQIVRLESAGAPTYIRQFQRYRGVPLETSIPYAALNTFIESLVLCERIAVEGYGFGHVKWADAQATLFPMIRDRLALLFLDSEVDRRSAGRLGWLLAEEFRSKVPDLRASQEGYPIGQLDSIGTVEWIRLQSRRKSVFDWEHEELWPTDGVLNGRSFGSRREFVRRLRLLTANDSIRGSDLGVERTAQYFAISYVSRTAYFPHPARGAATLMRGIRQPEDHRWFHFGAQLTRDFEEHWSKARSTLLDVHAICELPNVVRRVYALMGEGETVWGAIDRVRAAAEGIRRQIVALEAAVKDGRRKDAELRVHELVTLIHDFTLKNETQPGIHIRWRPRVIALSRVPYIGRVLESLGLDKITVHQPVVPSRDTAILSYFNSLL